MLEKAVRFRRGFMHFLVVTGTVFKSFSETPLISFEFRIATEFLLISSSKEETVHYEQVTVKAFIHFGRKSSDERTQCEISK